MSEQRGEDDSLTAIENKLILKRAVEHRAKQILEKQNITEKEVYDLVRGFFKKYLGIDYEFTVDELMRDFRKVYVPEELQDRVKVLLARVAEMEHVSREFSRDELAAMITEFKKIVDELIVSHYEANSILKKLWHGMHSMFSNKHKRLLEQKGLSMLTESERVTVKMNILLDNARRLSEKDFDSAKRHYEELLHIYSSLDEEKKRSYYHPVNELYTLLNSKKKA